MRKNVTQQLIKSVGLRYRALLDKLTQLQKHIHQTKIAEVSI